MTSRSASGLWRSRDFLRLWAGQSVSEFGSWMGALSLLAILVMDATPAQMGLFETLKALPALLVGLFAGVWVDRVRRRPLLIASDLGRALLLGLVVAATTLGLATMNHLYVVAFLVGALTVLFDIAYRAYVPSLVKRERLVDANSKLSATSSLAEIASPGLGGVLVQLITAPVTLLLDALTYIISAFFLGSIRAQEAVIAPEANRDSVWRDIVKGLRMVLGHRLLRPLAAAALTRSFFGGFFAALYSLYVLRTVGLNPAMLGLLIGSGGIGSLVGALVTTRAATRLGMGNAIIVSLAISGLLALLVPLAAGPKPVAAAMLIVSQLVGDTALTIYFISNTTLLQSITPDSLLGRVNASYEFLVGGLGTLGIAAGGLAGQFLGLRAALAAAATFSTLAFLWLFFSPVRGLVSLRDWQVVE